MRHIQIYGIYLYSALICEGFISRKVNQSDYFARFQIREVMQNIKTPIALFHFQRRLIRIQVDCPR